MTILTKLLEEDVVDKIFNEHDGGEMKHEDDNRHLTGMTQLTQQSEANNTTKCNYKLSTQLDRHNSKHGPQLL